jgi:DNA repair protein RecN (Recombination protein N)
MLLRLSIRDFVICEEAALEFSRGFNALTGETGAGKSILIDAIGFLAGGRGSTEWIRRGRERLAVEGAFDAASFAPEARAPAALGSEDGALAEILQGEDLLILRREMSADGRSRCFANGRQVLVSQLRELTRGALWIVGQGEQRALAAASEQEWLLDRYAGSAEARRAWRGLRVRFVAAHEEIERLISEREAFAREEDWLRFQDREIAESGLRAGERDRLAAARLALRAREKDAAIRAELTQRLFSEEGSILDHLESMAHRLGSADPERWGAVRDSVLDLRAAARELRELLGPAGGVDPDLEELGDADTVEERLRQLDRLFRKYGGDEAAVLAHGEEVRARLSEGEKLSSRIAEAATDLAQLGRALGQAGSSLARLRREAAVRFARAAAAELGGLGMAGASLAFSFHSEPDEEGVRLGEDLVRPLENGLEACRLLFRSHPSEAEGELSRVASGGELSRILLSIHAALGEAGPPGCWVLDEIDQGIGGDTANRVGERLARMSRRAQVLLVTHLPAIAARADRQFRVIKEEAGGRPVARVAALDQDARLSELARMLSGAETSAIARRHAEELLAAAARGRPPKAAGGRSA